MGFARNLEKLLEQSFLIKRIFSDNLLGNNAPSIMLGSIKNFPQKIYRKKMHVPKIKMISLELNPRNFICN